ncbi:MAG: thiamine phosphate synthase [Pseudomonadota bacterium]
MNERSRIDIVLGILREPSGHVWAEIRPDDAHLAGQLAFVGGKRAPGESPREALRRELAEEAGIEVVHARRVASLVWDYPDRRLRLIGFVVTSWRGEPHGREDQRLVRRRLDVASRADWIAAMPEANRGLVNALVLPRCLAITPPVEAGETVDGWIVRIRGALKRLPAEVMVNLRPGTAASVEQWNCLVDAVAGSGHLPVVNPAGDADFPLGIDPRAGLHLNHPRLARVAEPSVAQWQREGRLLTAAAHDGETLARADALELDLVTLSPVRETRSHPGQPGMGWKAFGERVAGVRLPVLALGGVSPADLPRVRRQGGHGIASISAFW